MPATSANQRAKVQRDYVARHREDINASRRLPPVLRLCSHCGEEFTARPYNRLYCYVCCPPFDKYAKHILVQFNLSRSEWNAMFAAQNGICAMPGCDNRAKVVDHNHKTGNVRKLLCVSCNVFVGWYENAERRAAAETYLAAAEMVKAKLPLTVYPPETARAGLA